MADILEQNKFSWNGKLSFHQNTMRHAKQNGFRFRLL